MTLRQYEAVARSLIHPCTWRRFQMHLPPHDLRSWVDHALLDHLFLYLLQKASSQPFRASCHRQGHQTSSLAPRTYTTVYHGWRNSEIEIERKYVEQGKSWVGGRLAAVRNIERTNARVVSYNQARDYPLYRIKRRSWCRAVVNPVHLSSNMLGNSASGDTCHLCIYRIHPLPPHLSVYLHCTRGPCERDEVWICLLIPETDSLADISLGNQ